jgi:hypothetical protein
LFGCVQHGTTYAFCCCHIARQELPQYRIERSHHSVECRIPYRLRASAVKRLNVRRAKQVHSFRSHLQEGIFCSAFYPRSHLSATLRAVGSAPDT